MIVPCGAMEQPFQLHPEHVDFCGGLGRASWGRRKDWAVPLCDNHSWMGRDEASFEWEKR
jgi:hypothetical protein